MQQLSQLIHPHKLMVLAAVVKHQNITHAAKAIHMTQPAVTNIIRQLEQHFEQTLVTHHGKKIMLTNTAKRLAEHWQQFESLYDNLYQDLKQQQLGECGPIKLAMVSTGKYFMPAVISDFLQRYPGSEFHCQVMHREQLMAGVLSGEFDLGIITNPEHHRHIVMQKLADNELAFVARRRHPLAKQAKVSFRDLLSQQFITRENSALITQTLYDYFARYHKTPNVLYEIDSTEAVKEAVLTSDSLALVPLKSIQRTLKNRELVSLPIKVPRRYCHNDWYVIRHNAKILNSISERFLAHLMASLI